MSETPRTYHTAMENLHAAEAARSQAISPGGLLDEIDTLHRWQEEAQRVLIAYQRHLDLLRGVKSVDAMCSRIAGLLAQIPEA